MPLKSTLLPILATLSVLAYGYIGLFHSTFYKMELILLPIALALCALISLIIILVKRSLKRHYITIFLTLSTVCFTSLIIEHSLSAHKPNLNIYIPEEFEGMVTLFPSNGKSLEVYVDENGIGYLPDVSNVDFFVFQGSKDLTDALNESGQKTLFLPSMDSLHYQAIEFSCFEIVKHRKYPSTHWNQKHALCMDEAQFDSLVRSKVINQDKISIKTFLEINK